MTQQEKLHMKTLMTKSIMITLLFTAVFLAAGCNTRGIHGEPGAPGQQGAPGQSIVGPQGPTGSDGSTPSAPTVAVEPTASQTCLNGGLDVLVNMVVIGTICNGNNGAVGDTGATGAAGQDSHPIQFVQFCAGTPVYPSSFPEYGILQDGIMYGVYSANDGFLAELPPGYYASNAIGSSCNFTINADGTVTR